MPEVYFNTQQRPQDDEIREYVKQECEGIVLLGGWSGKSNKQTLHIPDGSREIGCCNRCDERMEWRQKSLSVYPPGSKRWCTVCLAAVFPDRANSEVNS